MTITPGQVGTRLIEHGLAASATDAGTAGEEVRGSCAVSHHQVAQVELIEIVALSLAVSDMVLVSCKVQWRHCSGAMKRLISLFY